MTGSDARSSGSPGGPVLAVVVLAGLWLGAGPACAAEYEAARFDTDAGYVKEARMTRLTYIAGRSERGCAVKRDRHERFHQWHYERGDWWLIFKFRYPPAEMLTGRPVTVPMSVRVVRAGDEPLVITGTARVKGIRSRERLTITPAWAGRKQRGGPVEQGAGEVRIVPRLDWDAPWIELRFAYGDGDRTAWEVAEFHYRSNRVEQPRLPGGRVRDTLPPP